MNSSMKQKQTHRLRREISGQKGSRWGGGRGKPGGWDYYAAVTCKTDNPQDVLYSTGDCTQYSGMASMGKEPNEEQIYVSLIRFAVQQKLTQKCKSTAIKCF